MNKLIYLSLSLIVVVSTILIPAYSIDPPNLDIRYTIPEAQFAIANYHFQLYLDERNNRNSSSAQEHFRFAMMQDEERRSFLDAITVFENKSSIPTLVEISEPVPYLARCILTSDKTFVCP
jgi:hypothetical protein